MSYYVRKRSLKIRYFKVSQNNQLESAVHKTENRFCLKKIILYTVWGQIQKNDGRIHKDYEHAIGRLVQQWWQK